MSDELSSYLILSSALFSIGLYGLLCRRNIIAILISLELLLSAASVNFVAFQRFLVLDKASAQTIVLFIMGLAAAELCVALSLAILLCRKEGSIWIDKNRELKG